MKKLFLLLLFSLIHLVPANIQPMEENKKQTIYEFFSIKKQQKLPSEIKEIIAKKTIGIGGWWYIHKKYGISNADCINLIKPSSLNQHIAFSTGNPDGTLSGIAKYHTSTLVFVTPFPYLKTPNRLWKIDESPHKQIATFEHLKKPKNAMFNPNNKLVFITFNKTATLLNLNGTKLATFKHQHELITAFFDTDQKVFTLLNKSTLHKDKTIVVWKKYQPIHQKALEQVLLKKLLHLYVETAKRKPVGNIKQINTFFEHVEKEFHLNKNELIKIWNNFDNKKMKLVIFNDIMKRAIKK